MAAAAEAVVEGRTRDSQDPGGEGDVVGRDPQHIADVVFEQVFQAGKGPRFRGFPPQGSLKDALEVVGHDIFYYRFHISRNCNKGAKLNIFNKYNIINKMNGILDEKGSRKIRFKLWTQDGLIIYKYIIKNKIGLYSRLFNFNSGHAGGVRGS